VDWHPEAAVTLHELRGAQEKQGAARLSSGPVIFPPLDHDCRATVAGTLLEGQFAAPKTWGPVRTGGGAFLERRGHLLLPQLLLPLLGPVAGRSLPLPPGMPATPTCAP
jgi:hypothetical protein